MKELVACLRKLFEQGPASISVAEIWHATAMAEADHRNLEDRVAELEQRILFLEEHLQPLTGMTGTPVNCGHA